MLWCGSIRQSCLLNLYIFRKVYAWGGMIRQPCFNPFLFRKMHAWVWDDQAILLLKTLIPRKGELLKQSASASRLGKNYILLLIWVRIIYCWKSKIVILKNHILYFLFLYLCIFVEMLYNNTFTVDLNL